MGTVEAIPAARISTGHHRTPRPLLRHLRPLPGTEQISLPDWGPNYICCDPAEVAERDRLRFGVGAVAMVELEAELM